MSKKFTATLGETVKSDSDNIERPPSTLLSKETLKILAKGEGELKALGVAFADAGPSLRNAPLQDIPMIRKRYAEAYYAAPRYQAMIKRYDVKVSVEMIAGVYCEVFTPSAGVSPANENSVLLNIHGGGFINGARYGSRVESIPIAALAAIKVISVDYRLAPEHCFPAATDDLLVVYKHLLQQYQAKNIGVYGCSAGGVLTAQCIARWQMEGLPLPAAIGMTCGAAYSYCDGDSAYTSSLVSKTKNLYLDNAPIDSPLVFPGNHPLVLAKFPPALLVTATRDFALSSVVKTHSELIRLGVKSDLYVWEGMPHAFIGDTELPESREAFAVMVGFFQKYLGQK